MFVLDGKVVWSASDLTLAAGCEYALLRKLDVRLGRAEALPSEESGLDKQVAELGDLHEQQVLRQLEHEHESHVPGFEGGVARIERAPSTSPEDLVALVETTRRALAADPDVVFQAGFFDGEFHGYADFLRRTPEGWLVADTKLARRAKVPALLQIAAYADQLQRWGLPLAPTGELILGTGDAVTYPLADLLPVFRERRARLRTLVAQHLGRHAPAGWYDEDMHVCGSCVDCKHAAAMHRDLVLVANLRMSQRGKLNEAGIRTLEDLAAAEKGPDGMARSTFERLRAQACLQLRQMEAEAEGRTGYFHEVFDAKPILELPDPSPGDLFFDFEGDPMFHDAGDATWGLEYLWGVQPAPEKGEFWHLWADDKAAERAALVQFMERVAVIREKHPDMHIYHYASYEVTALKRLTAQHKTHEEELDDLLRQGVFVDLYATVCASVRISQPSYSIKKLEPLYDFQRAGEVTQADDSIAEYHLYRALHAQNDPAAEPLRRNIVDYNHADCQSTLELCNWLRGLVAGVEPLITRNEEELATQKAATDDPELVALRSRLLSRSGFPVRGDRDAEQQAWAMLESALGYYKRENKPYWWAHFDRLLREPDEWADDKDVLLVEEAVVTKDWSVEGRQSARRRTLELRGRAGASSSFEVGSQVVLLYELPGPQGMAVPANGVRGWVANGFDVSAVSEHADGRLTLRITEVNKQDVPDHHCLPMAVAPDSPPRTRCIEDAICSIAELADRDDQLPKQPGIDILLRRPPRFRSRTSLADTGDRKADLVDSLLDLDRSYLAVQGPPGTGKTYLGSRVIAELVQRYHWKVGVVGPSHAVVENMLSAIVEAGLDSDVIAKKDTKYGGKWRELKQLSKLAKFAEERESTGFVLGGTAWNLTNQAVGHESLDLLVVDEAGQFSLAATLGVSVAAKRLLVLGDPQQLPQVAQGTHGEPVDEAALSWVIDGRATMPRHLGYFLETSYRMHPAVCEAVSKLSYNGELEPDASTSKRSLEGVAPGIEVVSLDHQDNSVCSPEEAHEVVQRVQEFLGRTWDDPRVPECPRPLTQDDFLVVAPYNAQRQLIRNMLRDAGLADVRVGTVDKFQGQQAPVVIISMTASSNREVPRGMGFLLNRHRVNVAVSRAQWLAVLIRNRNLTSFVPSTPDGLLELGGFIGLCETGAGDIENA